jgi:hypothetical protein
VGAEGGGNRIDDGIDTFVFRDGLIRVQTVRYTLQSAPWKMGMAIRQDIQFDAEVERPRRAVRFARFSRRPSAP